MFTPQCAVVPPPGKAREGQKLSAQMGKLDQANGKGGVRVLFRVAELRRNEVFDHCGFVTGLELGASQAVLPRLQRKLAPFDYLEAELLEKALHIRESEDGMQAVFERFQLERLDDGSTDAAAFRAGIDGQRPDLAAGGRIEVERAAADELALGEDEREVADVL